ncbi:MAG TPA: polyprenol phosphomannose-dependent alpha 1,6 mannosyltransferase MptB, partial [Acidimicrobiales bacterium]|nr:polyprenol phosphomannose-dependent alpha 1,6 mannosyltransferase MptB [Acidimicrobiales bacterium]
WVWVESRFNSWRHSELPVEPYVAGVTKLGRSLVRPVVLGFVGTTAIFFGATQPNSPFTSKLLGSWYFGIPPQPLVQGYNPAPGQWLFLGVVAVYGGILLLLRAWYDIVKLTSRRPGIPVARLVPVFVVWVLPLLVVAPLFSRDVYDYAAQGEMMSHGINPYLYGTSVIGSTPFSNLVDPLWKNVSSPYGPLFLIIDGWIVTLAHHNLLLSVVGLRALALGGVVMFALAVPSIARSFGRDPGTAFALAALSPLVLLHLVAGAHNDALMLGFLVAGYALARRGRPVIGIVLCGCAAAVKIPALIGAVYIGWAWLGEGRSIRERVRPVATALLIALGTMVGISEAAGLGWGWVSGLTNPDTVRSWLDPATGIALVLGHLVTIAGLGYHTHGILTVTRGSAFFVAAVISLWLLGRSERIGPLKALGWSLLVVVLLSPVVQPWYLSWGFVFLAPIAEGLVRRIVVVVSGIACFLGLPGGWALADEIGAANPVLVAVACTALVAIGAFFLLPKFRRISPARKELVGSP